MYKIIVKGEAKTSYSNLEELDGIDCQDEFSEYFGEDEESLKGVVTSGYMSFEYDKKENKLYTITEYQSTRELTEEELEILKEYTTGQWSDGIGEGFEQQPCKYVDTPYREYDKDDDDGFEDDNEGEVYISPWSIQQIVTIKQIKN